MNNLDIDIDNLYDPGNEETTQKAGDNCMAIFKSRTLLLNILINSFGWYVTYVPSLEIFHLPFTSCVNMQCYWITSWIKMSWYDVMGCTLHTTKQLSLTLHSLMLYTIFGTTISLHLQKRWISSRPKATLHMPWRVVSNILNHIKLSQCKK